MDSHQNIQNQTAIEEVISTLCCQPYNFSSGEIEINVIGELSNSDTSVSKLVVIFAQDMRSNRPKESDLFAPKGKIVAVVTLTKSADKDGWKVERLTLVAGKESANQKAIAAFLDTSHTRLVAVHCDLVEAVTAKLILEGYSKSERLIGGNLLFQIDSRLPPLSIELLSADHNVIDIVNIP